MYRNRRAWTDTQLIDKAIAMGLGRVSSSGAFIVDTGVNTGRSTEERFLVQDETNRHDIHWSKTNQPILREVADPLFSKVIKRLLGAEHFEEHAYLANLSVHFITKSPWHARFARNMFRKTPLLPAAHDLPLRIYHDPFSKLSDYGISFKHDKVILLDTRERRVLIVGTAYAGEIKKSAFSMANYFLPLQGILPMHASANCKEDGTESTVLFGLSGTGKTTLSADPDRFLIGDDEIVWTETGISNLESGCYAKLIDLDPNEEPLIYRAVSQKGSILENVVLDSKGEVRFRDRSRTENTRGSFPLESVERVFNQSREAAAPKNIVFLTADAFGALPALAELNVEQATYHFLSGYTAKLAGTEIGVREPQAVFSACFGAPFMPRHPSVYAKLLKQRIEANGTRVWLLNTGWREVKGMKERFPISFSRSLLRSIQSGLVDNTPRVTHPLFGFSVPEEIPGIPSEHLRIPMGSGMEQLAKKFEENFKKYPEFQNGGPSASTL